MIELTLLSLNKKKEVTVAWIELNTPDGNFVVQPGYTPAVFLVSAGAEFIYKLKNGKEEVIVPAEQSLFKIEHSKALLFLQNL